MPLGAGTKTAAKRGGKRRHSGNSGHIDNSSGAAVGTTGVSHASSLSPRASTTGSTPVVIDSSDSSPDHDDGRPAQRRRPNRPPQSFEMSPEHRADRTRRAQTPEFEISFPAPNRMPFPFPFPPIEDAFMMAAFMGHMLGGGMMMEIAPPDIVSTHVQQEQNAARKRMKVDQEKRETDAILDGCHSVEALRDISVEDLRRVLAANLVPNTNLEKSGLIAAATQLWRGRPARFDDVENTGATHNECKICLSDSANCVFVDCGHMVTCVTCGQKVDTCPICRVDITKAIRVFT